MVDEEDDDDYMADLSRFIPDESVSRVPQRRNGKPASDGKDKLLWKEKKRRLTQERKVTQEQHKKEEEEQLKEGLSFAIPSSNIGFKMLQQMGYTPGVALGKHGQGLLEPVNIDLKRSRTGLGRDSAAKEEELVKTRRAEIETMRNRQKEKELRADFQGRRRDSWHSRKIISDYRKACATYLQLEESSPSSASIKQGKDNGCATQESVSVKNGVTVAGEMEETAEGAEEEITLEMLQEMLQKLQSQYNYCLYCGYKYDCAEALLASCPGLEEDAH